MPRPRRTIDEVSLPLAARLVNLWGHSLERLGLAPKPLEAGSLRRAAERAIRLHDRGVAVCFDPLLGGLLESACSEARLAPFGRALLRQECVSVLSQQLLAQELFRRHPEVREIPVERPLFIVGFFRSGTTLVQRLLGNHTDARNLRTWEALRPIPRGPSPRDGGEDRRIEEAERDLRVLSAIVPPRVHELETRAAEESVFLLRHAFSSLLQWGLVGSPGFLVVSSTRRRVPHGHTSDRCSRPWSGRVLGVGGSSSRGSTSSISTRSPRSSLTRASSGPTGTPPSSSRPS